MAASCLSSNQLKALWTGRVCAWCEIPARKRQNVSPGPGWARAEECDGGGSGGHDAGMRTSFEHFLLEGIAQETSRALEGAGIGDSRSKWTDPSTR